MGGKFWENSIRLIFLSPNHPSLFSFVILINQCIKKINWSYAHCVSQCIYAHRTCYRFSKSPCYTARDRIRMKRCIPVDIQYHSGDRIAVLNRIQLLDVSYGCIRYVSVVLIVSCVLLVVVSLQRPYFFFRVVVKISTGVMCKCYCERILASLSRLFYIAFTRQLLPFCKLFNQLIYI